jgi:fatty acid desaturase
MPTEPEANPAKKTQAAVSHPLGLHIYLYLLIAILLLCIACFLGAGFILFDHDSGEWTQYGVLGAPVAFLAALWFALGRCSVPEFSGLRGLLYITAYMSIGIGGFSMLIAIPAVMVAILGCLFFAMMSLFRSDPTYAPRRFRRMVSAYYRHRMYQ